MLTLAGVVAIGTGIVAVQHDPLVGFFEQLYPNDPERREALDLCFQENHRFNRLDATERDACYRQMLKPAGAPSPIAANVNFVDLWHAAGRGHQPQNDVRLEQQNTQYLRAMSGPVPGSANAAVRPPARPKYRLISRALASELPVRRAASSKP